MGGGWLPLMVSRVEEEGGRAERETYMMLQLAPAVMQPPGTSALEPVFVALLSSLKVVTFLPRGRFWTPQLQTVFLCDERPRVPC